MRSIFKAIHVMASNFRSVDGRRGAKALGAELEYHPTVFANKCNPEMETHRLTVEELVLAMVKTGDFGPLQAINKFCGYAGVPLKTVDYVGDVELLTRAMEWQREIGETAKVIANLPKGVISTEAVDELDRELDEDYIEGKRLVATYRTIEERPANNIVKLGDKR